MLIHLWWLLNSVSLSSFSNCQHFYDKIHKIQHRYPLRVNKIKFRFNLTAPHLSESWRTSDGIFTGLYTETPTEKFLRALEVLLADACLLFTSERRWTLLLELLLFLSPPVFFWGSSHQYFPSVFLISSFTVLSPSFSSGCWRLVSRVTDNILLLPI